MAKLKGKLAEAARRIKKSEEYIAESISFEISLQIARQLKANGLSQADFAALLNVSPAYVSQLLSGSKNLTIESLAKLSHALKLVLTVRLDEPEIASDTSTTITDTGSFESLMDEAPRQMGVILSFSQAGELVPNEYGGLVNADSGSNLESRSVI